MLEYFLTKLPAPLKVNVDWLIKVYLSLFSGGSLEQSREQMQKNNYYIQKIRRVPS